jgi:enoyl-CoA hydratase
MTSPALVLSEICGKVAVLTLNRSEKLNALNDALADAISAALVAADADPNVHVIVLTGNEKAFAAGADIAAMADYDYAKVFNENFITRNWEQARNIRKPIIAAVSGYALGGGCELAMMCDMIIAGDTAKFGQPEITIGTIPGMGGTQRLPRAIGKAKAMEWCLTGGIYNAHEAEKAGLVARVVPTPQLMEETMAIANKIASFSLPIIMKIKESINQAFEMNLATGLLFERREFHATFATDDRREGMAAFVKKAKPTFTNR